MNIIEKLAKRINVSIGRVFYYGAQGDVNVIMERAKLPCVFAYLIEQGTVETTNGVYKERLTLALFFVDKTNYGFESIENEDVIDKQKKDAFRFLSKWQRSIPDEIGLDLVSVGQSQRVYDTSFDTHITGYAVNVTIEDAGGIINC